MSVSYYDASYYDDISNYYAPEPDLSNIDWQGPVQPIEDVAASAWDELSYTPYFPSDINADLNDIFGGITNKDIPSTPTPSGDGILGGIGKIGSKLLTMVGGGNVNYASQDLMNADRNVVSGSELAKASYTSNAPLAATSVSTSGIGSSSLSWPMIILAVIFIILIRYIIMKGK